MASTALRRLLWLPALSLALAACSGDAPTLISQTERSQAGSHAVAFSPDNQYLVVADTEENARLWRLADNEVIYSWQSMPDAPAMTSLVGFSGDGRFVATAEYDTVMLWSVASGEPFNRVQFPFPVRAMALSPTGNAILVALTNRTAVYFDINRNRVVHVFQHDGSNVNSPVDQLINAVAISPDGLYAMTGGDDWTARLWQLDNGEQLQIWPHNNSINFLAFHPEQSVVITAAANGYTHLREYPTGEERYFLRSSPWPSNLDYPDFPVFLMTTTAVAFSTDGNYMVTGHANEQLCLWQFQSGEKISCWKTGRRAALNPGSVVQAVAFSADGQTIFSESGNGLAEQWQRR
ncbi:WD40 repeat domain-containing protein [Methylophaga lonarensis]|nr:hypothetical protein [Methylophaga lonarensis]